MSDSWRDMLCDKCETAASFITNIKIPFFHSISAITEIHPFTIIPARPLLADLVSLEAAVI